MTAVETALGDAVRAFHAEIPQSDVDELTRRVGAARWPDKETVGDQSQGAQLDGLQRLASHWSLDYDWRRTQADLNAFPQFITEMDGVDIHFIHVRSAHENALPLIITHGWPGSVLEMLKVIEPLSNPTKYGGVAEDAFHLVIPSLPGYGFSGRPTEPGWGPDRVASVWDGLMKRLGYDRYVAQGGDWGSVVCEAMGRLAPPGLLGIHVNLPAAVPGDVEAWLAGTAPMPELTDAERETVKELGAYRAAGYAGYFVALTNRPQAVGYGLTDSPIGLAAFMLWHPGFSKWNYGDDATRSPSRDEVLGNVSLYWLTNTAASSGRFYWENHGASVTSATAMKTAEIAVPVAVTVFPDDVYRPPESWARRAYPNLLYYNAVDKGGHFAAWEQPALFTSELRAAFKSLR